MTGWSVPHPSFYLFKSYKYHLRSVKAAGGYTRGRIVRSAPLCRILLVLFLAEQEKYDNSPFSGRLPRRFAPRNDSSIEGIATDLKGLAMTGFYQPNISRRVAVWGLTSSAKYCPLSSSTACCTTAYCSGE